MERDIRQEGVGEARHGGQVNYYFDVGNVVDFQFVATVSVIVATQLGYHSGRGAGRGLKKNGLAVGALQNNAHTLPGAWAAASNSTPSV